MTLGLVLLGFVWGTLVSAAEWQLASRALVRPRSPRPSPELLIFLGVLFLGVAVPAAFIRLVDMSIYSKAQWDYAKVAFGIPHIAVLYGVLRSVIESAYGIVRFDVSRRLLAAGLVMQLIAATGAAYLSLTGGHATTNGLTIAVSALATVVLLRMLKTRRGHGRTSARQNEGAPD